MFKSNTSEDFGKTLSLLWLFAILNTLFRDVHELTTASSINEILSGHLNGNPVTEGVLLAGAFAVEILLLSMLLSSLLAPRPARALNLVAAPLAIAGIFLVPPSDPDDYFFATVVVGNCLTICILSWNWRSAPRPNPSKGEQNVL